MLEGGEIRIPEIRTSRLDDAAEALEQVGSCHTRGKVVVIP